MGNLLHIYKRRQGVKALKLLTLFLLFAFLQMAWSQDTVTIQDCEDIHIANGPALDYTPDGNNGTAERLVICNYKC